MSSITFSGLASGIDTSTLITSLVSRERSAKVAPLENKISRYEDTKDSLTKLKSLLNNLKSNVEKFRTLSGGILSKTTLSSDETILSTSTSNIAGQGNYDITVKELAKTGSFSFSSRFLTASDKIAPELVGSDTITISVGTEETELTITSETTIQNVIDGFNALNKNGQASLINVGTSTSQSLALMVTSKEAGLTKGEISITVGEKLKASNLSLDPTLGKLSQAQNAKLSIAGLADDIERSSNTISDLIPGISFKLNAIGTVNISTSVDTENTSSVVNDFVDTLNEVVSYIKENDLISTTQNGKETKIVYGSLSSTSIDENVLSALRASLSNSRTSGGSVNILSELGITTKRDGTLAFDENKFKEALVKDSNSVERIFTNLGEDLGGVNGKIYQLTGFNAVIDQGINTLSNQISDTNNKISSIESSLAKYEARLTRKYAGLESLVGKLNAQSSSLISLLGSMW